MTNVNEKIAFEKGYAKCKADVENKIDVLRIQSCGDNISSEELKQQIAKLSVPQKLVQMCKEHKT
jgi:cell division protein FtsL